MRLGESILFFIKASSSIFFIYVQLLFKLFSDDMICEDKKYYLFYLGFISSSPKYLCLKAFLIFSDL